MPSSADARALLAEMVDIANNQGWEQLCALNGGSAPLSSCLRAAEELGGVPLPFRVNVVAERILEPDPPSSGGRVLSTCVYQGDEATETDVLIISGEDGQDGMLVPYPHFWEQRHFSAGGNLAIPSPTLAGSPSPGPCG